jgi:hypothetical protein
VIALFLVLPTVLLAGWMAMWLVHRPLIAAASAEGDKPV